MTCGGSAFIRSPACPARTKPSGSNGGWETLQVKGAEAVGMSIWAKVNYWIKWPYGTKRGHGEICFSLHLRMCSLRDD